MFRRVDRKSILEIGRVAAGTIRGQYKSLEMVREIYESQIYTRARTFTHPASPSAHPIRPPAYMRILRYADRVTGGKVPIGMQLPLNFGCRPNRLAAASEHAKRVRVR